jgi:hypothetical protein
MNLLLCSSLTLLGSQATVVPDLSPAEEAAFHTSAHRAGEGSIYSRSFGLTEEQGNLEGGGPEYKVRFTERGFEFTPALGGAAPRNFPLAFSLESVRRGKSVPYEAPPGGVPPVKEGLCVR